MPSTAKSLVSLHARFTEDHRRMEGLVSRVLDGIASNDRKLIALLWDQLDSGLSAHLDAEDKYMIPVLLQCAERDARAIMHEHRLIRERLAQLDTAVDLHLVRLTAVKSFLDELQAHAAHEDTLLYTLSDKMVNEAHRTSILRLISGSPA